MIRFACPTCATTFSVTDDKAGKTSNCPKCQSPFVVPGGEESPPPLPNAAVVIDPCPQCRTQLSVEPGDVGADVECPNCATVFTARKTGAKADSNVRRRDEERPQRKRSVEDDDDRRQRRPSREEEDEDFDRPRRSSRRDDDDDDDFDRPRRSSRRDEEEDDDFADRPRRRRGSTSRARDAVAAPAIVLLVVGVLGCLYGIFNGIYHFGGFDKNNQQIWNRNGNAKGQAPDPAVKMGEHIGAGISVIWGPIVVLGALKMKNLQNYTSAMIGSIVAIIPCNAGCCIGIFVGIWCIVVLQKDFVKRSFES